MLQQRLRAMQERLEPLAAKNALSNPPSVAPSGPFTIMDMNTGELKLCNRVGNMVNCF